MYFYRNKGQQVLNMKGDLVLTKNAERIATRSKSAGPSRCYGGSWVTDISSLRFAGKIKATAIAIRFIWGSK